MSVLGPTDCQHPHCSRDAKETYTGSNGNRLKLCERHYYNAVTDDAPVSLPPDNSDDGALFPFWDPGIRVSTNNTSSDEWEW